MATFQDLTSELIDILVSHVDPSTFCGFRLASRECYDRSYKEFTRRICGLRYLALPHSLDTLLQITEKETLAAKIKKFQLCACAVGDDGHEDFLFDLLDGAETPDARLAATTGLQNYHAFLKAQQMFWKGDDVATYSLILSRLPGLETVEIGDPLFEDEPTWHGAKTYGDETGLGMVELSYDAPDPDGRKNAMTHNFQAILRALSITKKPIRQLVARLGSGNCTYPGIEVFEMIPLKPSYYLNGLRTALASLRHMELTVSFRESTEHLRENEKWLAHFVNLAPLLQTLRLKFDGWIMWPSGKPDPNNPFHYGFESFAAEANLPHLNTFALQGAAINPLDLLAFCERHKLSIMDLELRDVALLRVTWAQVFDEVFDGILKAISRISLSRLEEWHSPKDGDRNMIIFDKNGLRDCLDCVEPIDSLRPSNDCSHISKVFSGDELSQITSKAVPWKKFMALANRNRQRTRCTTAT